MTDETILQWSEPCTTLGPDVVSDFRAGSSTDADFADQTPREVQTVLGSLADRRSDCRWKAEFVSSRPARRAVHRFTRQEGHETVD